MNLLTKTMATMGTTIAMTPRGWQLAWTKSSRARHRPTSTFRGRGPLRGRQAGPVTINKGSPLHAALAPIPPLCLRRVGPSPARNLLLCLGRAIELRP